MTQTVPKTNILSHTFSCVAIAAVPNGTMEDFEAEADILPINRPPCCSETSYYDVNGLGTFNLMHREHDDDDTYDFYYNTTDIVDVHFYAPQIHPIHYHINKFQLVELPPMDSYTDYFQVGDYHDVFQATISDYYGKAVLRMAVGGPLGPMLGHCHIYRHSDRGMAYLGYIQGEEGLYNEDLVCYSGFEGRGYEIVESTDTPAPTPPPGTPTTISPTADEPGGGGDDPTIAPTDLSAATTSPACVMMATLVIAVVVSLI